MFGLFKNPLNAVTLLKADHLKVKRLFRAFEKSPDPAEKKRLCDAALQELKIHAAIEEDLFYPAVREAVSPDKAEMFNEADEEHHVAKLLIAELERMDGTEDHFNGKFTVLAENIRHHIKEEEGDMLPVAEDSMLDLDALGQKMARRKQELMISGAPGFAEEVAVGRGGDADSPAQTARRRASSPQRLRKAS